MAHHSTNEKKFPLMLESKTVLKRFVFAVLYVLLLWPAIGSADKVTDWNEIAVTAMVTNLGKAPPATFIDLAYVSIAVYDAVNAIDGRYTPFSVSLDNVPADASQESAAVAAAYNVLKVLLPTQLAYLDSVYATSLATIPDGLSKDNGIAVGEDVAAQFLASRAGDGRNANITYTPGSGPGVWQPTPPAFLAASTPWIAYMRPFAILTPSQFRAEGPPALSSNQWAADFNETKSFGSLTSVTRTPEQTEIGRFYAEHPAGQVARNLRNFAIASGMSLADNARLLAVLHVSVADAIIAAWDSKFFYGFWRPVTAIRAADTDGNPDTLQDPSWIALVVTPNHPEYPAAHGCVTGAYADALRRFFGTKRVNITLTSTFTGTSHNFTNTNDLIKETTEARIYGGMHYRTSCIHGAVIGKKVARWVADHYFQPIN